MSLVPLKRPEGGVNSLLMCCYCILVDVSIAPQIEGKIEMVVMVVMKFCDVEISGQEATDVEKPNKEFFKVSFKSGEKGSRAEQRHWLRQPRSTRQTATYLDWVNYWWKYFGQGEMWWNENGRVRGEIRSLCSPSVEMHWEMMAGDEA